MSPALSANVLPLKPNVKSAQEYEKNIDVEALVKTAVETVEVIKI